MASNTQIATTILNQQADLIARALDNGYFKIYDGAQPATADTPVTTQNELVSLRFSPTSAPAAINGTITLSIIDGIASMDGVMSWYRCYSQDETTVIMDGNIGLSDATIIFYNVNILNGQQISISLQHTVEHQ